MTRVGSRGKKKKKLVNWIWKRISLLMTKCLCIAPFRKQNVINEGALDKEKMDTSGTEI